MIWVAESLIGAHGKSEKISAAHLARRLVIQWTALLPPMQRDAGTR